MEFNKPYIVTKGSNCGTFQVGDHIKLATNGDLLCKEAGGWIDKEFVKEATIGMEFAFDVAYVERKRQILQAQLAALDC